LLYEAKRKVFWTGVRFSPPPPKGNLMNDDKELIDKGTYYEIKDYEPIVNRDENGNVVSVIHCPYIPKFLSDGGD